MERGRLIMTRYDFDTSRALAAADVPFEALIMAALRRADSSNAATLRAAFPVLAAETQERYDAPGGILRTDPDAVEELARRIDDDAFAPGSYSTEEAASRARRQDRARGMAQARLGLLHEPGDPYKVAHPGGKDGWFRSDCTRFDCEYSATEPRARAAMDRVEQHADSIRERDTERAAVSS
jgi:hypothetical protein